MGGVSDASGVGDVGDADGWAWTPWALITKESQNRATARITGTSRIVEVGARVGDCRVCCKAGF